MKDGNNTSFCAGIVTYNPDINRLRENIEHVTCQVDKVLIIDNCSDNAYKLKQVISEFSDVELISLNTNKGVAYALNYLCTVAIEKDYSWILTLDQDSICPYNLIETYLGYTDNDVAIISPSIIYRNNENYSIKSNSSHKIVDWALTSASFTNLEIWKTIGGFDNDLFIDYVDYDYCIRAKIAGYKTIKVYNVCLLHELGNLKIKKIGNILINVTNHVSFRYYYMSRNAIIMNKKLHTINASKEISKLLLKIILFENHKTSKINFIIKGVKDGLEYKI